HSQTGSEMNVIGDLRQFDGREPTKLILIDTPELTDRLQIEMQSQFGETAYVTKTNIEYLEFMNPQANKGAALAVTCSKLEIAREYTFAVGDGHNDLQMVQWAGVGVAMGNAREELKLVANRVIGHYNEDGLAIYLEELAGNS
ncbi:MAG: HAD hydrolase family protein, partial [Chthonomonadales bacterium]